MSCTCGKRAATLKTVQPMHLLLWTHPICLHLPPFQLFKFPSTTVSLNGKKVTCACLSPSFLGPKPRARMTAAATVDGRLPINRPPACRVPRMPTAVPFFPLPNTCAQFSPQEERKKTQSRCLWCAAAEWSAGGIYTASHEEMLNRGRLMMTSLGKN